MPIPNVLRQTPLILVEENTILYSGNFLSSFNQRSPAGSNEGLIIVKKEKLLTPFSKTFWKVVNKFNS